MDKDRIIIVIAIKNNVCTGISRSLPSKKIGISKSNIANESLRAATVPNDF